MGTQRHRQQDQCTGRAAKRRYVAFGLIFQASRFQLAHLQQLARELEGRRLKVDAAGRVAAGREWGLLRLMLLLNGGPGYSSGDPGELSSQEYQERGTSERCAPEHEAKVDVDEVALVVQQDVAVVPVAHRRSREFSEAMRSTQSLQCCPRPAALDIAMRSDKHSRHRTTSSEQPLSQHPPQALHQQRTCP